MRQPRPPPPHKSTTPDCLVSSSIPFRFRVFTPRADTLSRPAPLPHTTDKRPSLLFDLGPASDFAFAFVLRFEQPLFTSFFIPSQQPPSALVIRDDNMLDSNYL
jgi:hypothetical protein